MIEIEKMTDRSALKNKEIEITPQMVDAGIRVLRDSGVLEFDGLANDLLMRDILRAALKMVGKELIDSDG